MQEPETQQGGMAPNRGPTQSGCQNPRKVRRLPTEAGIGGECGAGGWSTDKEECLGGRVVLQAEMRPPHPYPHPIQMVKSLITSTSDWDCIWR